MRDIHGILRNEKVKGNLQSNRYNINQFLNTKITIHIYISPQKTYGKKYTSVCYLRKLGQDKTFPYIFLHSLTT